MRFAPGEPIIWRVALSSSPAHVFELLDTDAGRERFWSQRSEANADGFVLEFPGGLREQVTVLDRQPPTTIRILYFGAEADLVLTPSSEGGCTLQVTCRCEEHDEWMEFFPGWVSWLLVLKAAADFGIDLRNASPERSWSELYVDP